MPFSLFLTNVDKMRNININTRKNIIDQPNLVKIEECFQNNRYLYVVTELLSGDDLFTRLGKLFNNDLDATVSEYEISKIFKGIFSGVSFAHSKDIIHGDLKPSRFIFQTTDEASPIKITDFGISSIYDIKKLIDQDNILP